MQPKFISIFLAIGTAIAFSINSFACNTDKLNVDCELLAAMQAYHVPVVGYAIIKNYKIVAAKTVSINPELKVSKDSLFQAASISKSVSAYGALKLVSQGKLNLDESVNNKLTTWKIPINHYNANTPVTLRQLLDMTSGLSVSGFPGHSQGEPLPTLKEVLDGLPPSNTPPIRVFYTPGTQYFYSGGAFEVLEQLMDDTTKQSFSTWVENEVLKPLNMDHSVFQYPLGEKLRSTAVPGFLTDGTMIKGGWNNYAIPGAGGMWTTPTDLAKFAINISNAYLGKQNNIISESIAKQMLTRQKNTDFGLGVVTNGNGKTLNFRKEGHNLGYFNELFMFPNTGDGVIIMTDSESGEHILNFFIPVLALKYHWPCYFPYIDELVTIPKFSC